MAGQDKAKSLFFLLGPAYHGAGTMSFRLNLHPDVFAPGTGNPPRKGDPVCSCGESVAACPFWKMVKERLELAEDDPLPNFLPDAPFLSSVPKINTFLNGVLALAANEAGPRLWKPVYEPAQRFLTLHEKYFAAAYEWHAHQSYVDGSRSNLKFMAMASMKFPIRGVIHLVRDPRGYVASRKRYYPELSVEALTYEWVAAHTRINRLKHFYTRIPFHVLRYEDVMQTPLESLKKISNSIGLSDFEYEAALLSPIKNHMAGMREQEVEPSFAAQTEDWPQTLHPEDQARIIRAAGRLFGEFGYKA